MIWIAVLLVAMGLVVLPLLRRLGGPSRALSSVLLGLGLVVGLVSGFRVVPAGHVGVVVLFGSVKGHHLSEGLRLVNPFAVVYPMSIRTETYTMSGVFHEGQVKGDDSIKTLSADGLLMPMEVTVAYRLAPGDAPWVFRNIGPDYVDKIIRPASRTSVRETISMFTAQEAYSTRREQLSAKAHELLTKRINLLLQQREDSGGVTGFVIDEVMVRDIQLPEKVKGAIEQKLHAEQEALQMEFVLRKEEQEAERKRIEAQGIADFQRIVSQGISEPLLRWKGIEATEKVANSANTKVVIIGSGKDGLPIILNP
jgi:regulator of protease activity HflC (stomatin/prohibitin superfamily)